ncbi:MAG: chemotaxis protein CheW [Halodesulfurarchaeum sp.]
MGEENTSALEFSLGDGRYCVAISEVEEIVDAEEEITPVPNAEPHVEGVVDIRGETTTIVDPATVLDLEASTTGRRIILLSEVQSTGLLIDDVHQVLSVDPEELDDSTATETTRGVLRKDDRFVIWIEPETLVDTRET